MGFYPSIIFGFVTGIVVLAGIKYIQKRRQAQRVRKMVDLAMLSCVNKEDLRKLIPKELYPSWVQFPEFERVEWINYFLREVWPKLKEAISGAVMVQVEPILDSYRPAMISSLKLTKFNLGHFAPQLGGIDVVETKADEVVLHVDFNWVGDPSIILSIKTLVGVALQVQVKNLQIWGVFRVALTPLITSIPCFGSVVFALTTKPEINFTLKVAGGDMTAVPGLGDALDDLIRTAITDSLVWPVRHVIPIVPGNYDYLQMRTVGVLEVKLVEGRDLRNLALLGTIDPYATLFVRPIPSRTRRSRTIPNSVNPLWNHSFEFKVEDHETQRLVIKVWDDQELTASQPVGEAAISLVDLPVLKLADRWVPLVKDADDPKADTRPRGSIHLELLYRPVDENGVLLAPAYFTPPAPKTLQEAAAAANAAEARKTRQSGVGFLSPIKAQQQEDGEGGEGDVPSMALGGEQGGLAGDESDQKYMRGVLQVVLVSGRELVACDMNGLSDPFAVLELQLGGQRRKSRVVKKTLEPEWNESFEFLVEDGKHDMLVLALYDHDLLGKKDNMGRLGVSLTRVMMEGHIESEFQLLDAPHGWIKLKLTWKPVP
ncbi:hypothetical protein CLOM_g10938 [Closterium sp. NIES-68]|nr:hypothetical protein CLOM_g10938 [Closterium sp. NIES-68]GJP57804.1 hypothetical protein CLOP_g17395 [Closterium sp. NIES-67]